MEHEHPLTGGRMTTGVVRVGDTVRRPIKPRAAFAHDLLRHLETRGFTGAPKFMGADSAAMEILSFIPGSVPAELGHFTDAQLIAAARLLRQLHDATLDCPLKDGHEVVCHGDPGPGNCVFVDGVPSAFIDFDDAHPGTRLEDLGYAAWLWINIGNDDFPAETQGQHLAEFFKAYGASTDDAVPSILAAQAALAMRTSAAGVSKWAKTVHAWANQRRAWVERNRTKLLSAIAGR